MAHHKAKNGGWRPKCMVLEHSLTLNSQLRAIAGLEHSLCYGDLTQHLNLYLLSCQADGKAEGTLDHYRRRILCYISFARDCQLSSQIIGTRAEDIRLYIASLRARKLEPSTINAHYRALSAFFNWLIREGIIGESPMVNIRPPSIPNKLPQPFSKPDIERLMLLTEGDKFLQLRNRALVYVDMDTGLRLSELARIQLADIDLKRETIKVMGKGSKERFVRIGRKTQQALLRYLIMRNDEYGCLWVTEEKRPMKLRGVQVAIKKLCHKAEITDATPGPHTFRHTAAINCLRNGMGEFTLQMMLGHSTLQMTRRYVSSLNADDVIEAHKKASPVDNMRI